MTSAAWGFMGVIWIAILVCIGVSMKKIVKDQR